MAIRVRKSVKIAPGVRLNINKNSIGVSAGVKGARVSVNSNGRVTKSVGIPGTGIYDVETSTIGKSNSTKPSKKEIKKIEKEIENSQYLNPKKKPVSVGASPRYKKFYLVGMIISIIGLFITCDFKSIIPFTINLFAVIYLILAYRDSKWQQTEIDLRNIEYSKINKNPKKENAEE